MVSDTVQRWHPFGALLKARYPGPLWYLTVHQESWLSLLHSSPLSIPLLLSLSYDFPLFPPWLLFKCSIACTIARCLDVKCAIQEPGDRCDQYHSGMGTCCYAGGARSMVASPTARQLSQGFPASFATTDTVIRNLLWLCCFRLWVTRATSTTQSRYRKTTQREPSLGPLLLHYYRQLRSELSWVRRLTEWGQIASLESQKGHPNKAIAWVHYSIASTPITAIEACVLGQSWPCLLETIRAIPPLKGKYSFIDQGGNSSRVIKSSWRFVLAKKKKKKKVRYKLFQTVLAGAEPSGTSTISWIFAESHQDVYRVFKMASARLLDYQFSRSRKPGEVQHLH